MAERDLGRPDRLAAISALGEPTRRALYDHVAAQGGWVSRDQAADALRLERGTAAHHLDRLATDGLLEIDFQRLTTRRGPGAGRPAKLYRRARRDFEVSLPPRAYELAGRLLAEAADRSRVEGTDIGTALGQVATAEGRRLADEVRTTLTEADELPVRRQRALLDVLERHGFEPATTDEGTVVLRNCPFHTLAQRHADLICGMNLHLVGSAVDGVGDTGLCARLAPEEGFCCVRLQPGN